jgi:pullulanase/glycogen debranching enzyme
MAVILDIVFNHATGNHPFAKLYWEGSATAPNNPWFNVTAPHPYSVFHDFNHAYSGTREYFKRVLEHWLKEYKLDGFRFDLMGLLDIHTLNTAAEKLRRINPSIILYGENDVTEVGLDNIKDWDFVIENDSDYETLKVKALDLIKKLK